MSNGTPPCTVGYVNHVGIAVRNLEAVLALYQTLFDSPETAILETDLFPLRVAIIEQGETHIELLEPTEADSPIGRFIDRHGEGLHHLALNVDDIDAKVAQLKEKGIVMLDDAPRLGMTGRIAFISPAETYGSLIELVQPFK